MKSNEKNLIFNPKGENQHYYFRSIEMGDKIGLIRQHSTGRIYSVDMEKEEEKLSFGQPCLYTDIDFSFLPEFTAFYKNHTLYVKGQKYFEPKTKRKYATLGEMLRKVKKIEHLFPQGTMLNFHNHQYGTNEDGTTFGFDLKYITKRKFIGFYESFNVLHKCYFDHFTNDDILDKLIIFLRQHNFLVAVHDNVDFIAGPNHFGKIAQVHGYGLRIGFSELNSSFRGYGIGRENILFDKETEFNKWSRCNEIKKPTSESEFETILQSLIEHSQDK